MKTPVSRPSSPVDSSMRSSSVIEVFCEDRAHEMLLRPLVARLTREHGLGHETRVVSAKGGAPRVMKELSLALESTRKGARPEPRLLVVCIDGNCQGFRQRAKDIRDHVAQSTSCDLVVACPDPHIERWYLADQTAFGQVVGGQRIALPQDKCERGMYKQLLANAVVDAGKFDISGGIDFGPDLAASVDPFRLAKADASFDAFYTDLNAWLLRERDRRPERPESSERPVR